MTRATLTARVLARLAFAVLLVGTAANAEITAKVDRADVELNESFTLEITADSNIELQPDVSVLEQDFFVGQGSQLSNTTITNGQIRRSKTWTYILMPKRAGRIVIPAITLGNGQSNPVTVTVSEASYAPPGEADVFVTTEVDYDETYVQAQILLTLKIYRSVTTRQPQVYNPEITGIEALFERAGDDRNYEAVIDGMAYSVFERVLAIYPQESGQISISPARFEARVLRNGRISGRKVYQSEPLSVTVLPIPPLPADYPLATWLPARDVQLSEDWSRDASEITAGEPLTRHVIVSALGQIETQIPSTEPPTVDGINIYPDKPDLSRRVETGGIRGVRKDQYALIGVTAGEITLPPLELPWWDVTKSEWRVARLPARSISILPSGDPLPVEPDGAETAVAARSAEPAVLFGNGGLWRRVSEFLAALWLVTLVAWWWSLRPKRIAREAPTVPLHKQQARFLKTARKQALASNAAGVRSAMLEWARLQWPDDQPRCLGAIATRVSAPLADELAELSRLSYGPNKGDWKGEQLARALRSFAVLSEADAKSDELLPPLMPSA